MDLEIAIDKQLGGFRCTVECKIRSNRCGIFGPSGSGKSTLMHCVAGLLPPDRGRIRLDGETLFDRTAGISLSPERRRIGVVFQHAHLFPHLNVRRNLLYGWQRLAPIDRRIDPEQLITILNIGHLLKRGVHQLSGGERQRVALGRSVLAAPRLIIMDEPLSGLDADLKYQIIPYLQEVFSEFSIPLLLISHSLAEMRLLTDAVLTMRDGRLHSQTTAEELARSAPDLGDGYQNFFQLGEPQPAGSLWAYPWGGNRLLILEPPNGGEHLFSLDARDILLFKRHPEATSARNMLACQVARVDSASDRVAVELDCAGRRLVAQVVPEAVQELAISPGCHLVAVFKASSVRRLV